MLRTGDGPHPARPDAGAGTPGHPRIFGLLTGVAVVQFTSLAFFSFGLIAILRQRGVELTQLGLVQFTLVIPALRFLWAPLVDRSGRCRSWLLVLLPALSAAALGLATLEPERRLAVTLALVVVVAVLTATTNIAADALTVRLLDDASRGLGNGLRVAAGYAGTLISGSLLLVLYDRAGWSVTLCTVAGLALLPLLLLVGFREPPAAAPAGSMARGFAEVVAVLRRPGAARWALGVLPLYWTGVYAAAVLVDPMLVDAGWSLSRIALVVNTPAELTAMGTGLVTGLLLVRLGRRRALLLGGLAQVVAVGSLLPVAFGIAPAVPAALAVCAVKAAYAVAATVVTTVSMGFCRPESAGTDVAVLAALGSAVTAAAGAVALPVAGVAGYPVALGACLVVAVGATVIAQWLGPADAPTSTEVSRTTAG